MNQPRKQMLDVLEELDLAVIKPVLVKCLAVHNEADWVQYNLANCYDEFDIIRVIEGAVEGRPKSTPDGHSTDNTVELIRSFPDPDGKIELYQLDRPFKSLEEQKQVFLEVAKEGEWLLITDGDEFYHEGDVARIRKAIEARPGASELIPTFLHFYRDFGHVRRYHPEWNLWHQRIIRYRPGLRYHTHPIVTDSDGKCTYFSPEYQIKRYQIPVYIYHYGHAKPVAFHAQKQEFYGSELKKFALEDGTNASKKFDEKFEEFRNYKEPLAEVLVFDGEHPECLKEHPLWTFRDEFYKDKSLTNWKDSKGYSAKLPTIPQWMIFEKRMQALYNEIEI